ncbi:MAG: hypothetical protein GTN84_08430 [Hydrogenophaga sp.]|uniref:hypothetical protein n=1 Tax=Hydrogenophaga sp. TaxID=1904254 RepID=UPI001693B94F|nr:hypothetical protein [Hydrogenophaga sp.]NIM41117.1 hypothetical protein [Hydrogenophaga sp.]NIN26433.1 hypothetical protein [Hydrogenophaga sp.]NIN31308.1 hypothetical protein [Hydrogenophaga sp.]NIN55363.1 hypothetical protein [Hydrogenophaga sp.]NIO51698.1 hypothetical protein [Hydrogenophaga sp.]
MSTSTGTPSPSLDEELNRLLGLFAEYQRLAADGTSRTDLGARVGRIGGRVQAIAQFEAESLLPLLGDAALREEAGRQIEDLRERVERLAERSVDNERSDRGVAALAVALQAHAQWLSRSAWPVLAEGDVEQLRAALGEARARWQQDEAPD